MTAGMNALSAHSAACRRDAARITNTIRRQADYRMTRPCLIQEWKAPVRVRDSVGVHGDRASGEIDHQQDLAASGVGVIRPDQMTTLAITLAPPHRPATGRNRTREPMTCTRDDCYE